MRLIDLVAPRRIAILTSIANLGRWMIRQAPDHHRRQKSCGLSRAFGGLRTVPPLRFTIPGRTRKNVDGNGVESIAGSSPNEGPPLHTRREDPSASAINLALLRFSSSLEELRHIGSGRRSAREGRYTESLEYEPQSALMLI